MEALKPHQILNNYIDSVNNGVNIPGTESAMYEFLSLQDIEQVKATLKYYESCVEKYSYHNLYSIERQSEQLRNTIDIVIPFLKNYIKDYKYRFSA